MKRKFLGISSLAWIITIAIVLLFALGLTFNVLLYIIIGFSFIYLIALLIDSIIN